MKANHHLLSTSPLPAGYPRFDCIKDNDFLDALEASMAFHRDEVDAIAQQEAAPTIENTLLPLEKSEQALNTLQATFYNLLVADGTEERQTLADRFTAKVTAHEDWTLTHSALFQRLHTLYLDSQDATAPGNEDTRLLNHHHDRFVHSGALLNKTDQDRLHKINLHLAALEATFQNNLMAEVNNMQLLFDTQEELRGLNQQQLSRAAKDAEEAGHKGNYLLRLANTTTQPVLNQLVHRKVRERIHQASSQRGALGNQWDNRKIILEILKQRQERAYLLGFESHAHYRMSRAMAGSPHEVLQVLKTLITSASVAIERETQDLQTLIDRTQAENGEDSFSLQPWDWGFYTEQLARERFQRDENEIKPYFELFRVLEDGAFYMAHALYGLTFVERTDLPRYHPDINTYEVRDEANIFRAILIFDPYERPTKMGGAWMALYTQQSTLLNTQPTVAIHLNIIKPTADEPALLTSDEVIGLFHEFGHALHGILTNVRYPAFSMDHVPVDFIEFPSQLHEMWAFHPEVLRHYARHHESDEPLPQALLNNLIESSTFNQGYLTMEALAVTLLDLKLHSTPPPALPSAEQLADYEREVLAEFEIPGDRVPPRFHLSYFSHIMNGLDASIYGYLWAELKEAAVREWMTEHGGLTRDNGRVLEETILSQGNSMESDILFNQLYGKPLPVQFSIQSLLRKRGL